MQTQIRLLLSNTTKMQSTGYPQFSTPELKHEITDNQQYKPIE